MEYFAVYESLIEALQSFNQTFNRESLSNIKITCVKWDPLFKELMNGVKAYRNGIICAASSIKLIARDEDYNSKVLRKFDELKMKKEVADTMSSIPWSKAQSGVTTFGCLQLHYLFLLAKEPSVKLFYNTDSLLDLTSGSVAIKTEVNEIDALYKMYTSLYSRSRGPLIRMLEDVILHKASHIIESVDVAAFTGNVERYFLVSFLNLFLHRISSLFLEGQQFQCESSYVELFFHCLRHGKIKQLSLKSQEEYLSISNDGYGNSLSLTIKRKMFVKVIICLVNLIDAVVNCSEDVSLPKEVIAIFDLKPEDIKKKQLPEELITKFFPITAGSNV